MEIVKFKNGKYGIRKRNLWDIIFKNEGLFRDFSTFYYRWRKSDDRYFDNCQVDTFEVVENHFNSMKRKVIEKVDE